MTPIISIEFLRKYSFAWKTNIDPITRQPCEEILSLTIPINNSLKRKHFVTKSYSQNAPNDINLVNTNNVILKAKETSCSKPNRCQHLRMAK